MCDLSDFITKVVEQQMITAKMSINCIKMSRLQCFYSGTEDFGLQNSENNVRNVAFLFILKSGLEQALIITINTNKKNKIMSNTI